jgi:predicted HTH transcriptional regulator
VSQKSTIFVTQLYFKTIAKMKAEDILKLRDLGEDSKIQFKERILDKYDVGCELVAFSNSRGGQLVIGINDKTGAINPLSYQEVQETTNMLGNMASDNVVPSILLDIETVDVDGGYIVVANIKKVSISLTTTTKVSYGLRTEPTSVRYSTMRNWQR